MESLTMRFGKSTLENFPAVEIGKFGVREIFGACVCVVCGYECDYVWVCEYEMYEWMYEMGHMYGLETQNLERS